VLAQNEMKNKAQFRWPFLYKVLYTYASLVHRLYYKRFTVIGVEKIPENAPVIFAPNHQNALMDALAVLFASSKKIAFLARADIFKKPLLAKILNSLRMMPVFRIRDGFESLGQNQEIFDTTVNVLKSNIPLCILPEGNHEGEKRLRPLKKGIFRIAFQAEESAEFKLNLHIIPVGLDYSNYFNAGSDLLVVFGKPIRVADYSERFKANEQKTINTLRNELAEEMRNVMIHIPEDHYKVIFQMSEMYESSVWNTNKTNRHPYNKFTIKQYIVQKATDAFSLYPDKAIALGNTISAYNDRLKKYGLIDKLLQQKRPRFFSLFTGILLTILLMPIHIYGMLLNYLPYKIPVWAAANIKDQHFKGSIHFGISLLLFPLYYLIVISAFCFLTEKTIIKVFFALSIPLSGFFTFYNYRNLKKLLGRLRLFRLKLSSPADYKSLKNDRTQIIDQIKSTINS